LAETGLHKALSHEIKIMELDGENIARLEFISAIGALKEWKVEFQNLGPAELVLVIDCKAIANLLDRRERLEKSRFLSKRKGVELANADVYKEFLALFDELEPNILWVKGHAPKGARSQLQQLFSLVDKAARARLREES
jgi:ribonuclease HI